ncbi:hypothetical protein IAU60_001907 [Kwoniella sp. DSM 27419]
MVLELSPPRRHSLELPRLAAVPLLPVHDHACATRSRLTRPRRSLIVALATILGLSLCFHRQLGTYRRDLIYLLRPLWDTPPAPFTIIDHYALPYTREHQPDLAQWCALHGWSVRPPNKHEIVDAVLFNTELDMLEIRMREYAQHVSTFVILEANMTFSGRPKEAIFAKHRARFDRLLGADSRIVYGHVGDLLPDRSLGSFENEHAMRVTMGRILTDLRLPVGSVVIQSDVDEVVSASTLHLLSSCQLPKELHLNVDSYRYGYNFPIPDQGYWRPHLLTITQEGESVAYHHGRASDELLQGAGWHCSFCFPTLKEMNIKMSGYSHNDRLRDSNLAQEDSLRGREAFTFKDLIAQSGALRPVHSFETVPRAVRDDPDRFAYLLGGGCERPME